MIARLATAALAAAAVVLGAAGVANAPAGTGGAPVVRLVLVAAWAASALLVAVRGRPALGVIAAGGAALGGLCSATAAVHGATRLHALAGLLIAGAAFHLVVALPRGRVGRGTRRGAVIAVWLAAAAIAATVAAAGVRPNSWTVAASVLAASALAAPVANIRYRASVGIARQQLQLIGCGAAVTIEAALVIGALRLLVSWPPSAGSWAAASTVLVPLAIALGTSARVARQVDRVLLHTVSVTGLTAVVVAIYLAVVIGLGRSPNTGERSVLLLSMVAAAITSLAYVPARRRLSETANRLVYGERHPPDEVLRTWGSRLTRSIPMDELLLQLAESLVKVLDLRSAEVWTGSEERLELAVSVPDRRAAPLLLGAEERPVVARAGVSGNAWMEIWLPTLLAGRASSQLRVAPASHAGAVLGLLLVERRGDGDPFTEEDERVLTELARQLGLALHNVQLDSALQESLDDLRRTNEELKASRARIVATADAERRKLERNLHDGAQQHLVALAVNIRLARDIVVDDPGGAAELLGLLADSVKETIQELRDLAHGIYPKLLMDLGLPEALRAAATRSPNDVDVDTDGVGRYPSDIEAAVYFCCVEALQNAAKHAPGAQVAVRLRAGSGALSFEVADDGPGFDAVAASTGHGYVNMSDRLGAIGGTVTWRSAPGQGSCVSGTVPML